MLSINTYSLCDNNVSVCGPYTSKEDHNFAETHKELNRVTVSRSMLVNIQCTIIWKREEFTNTSTRNIFGLAAESFHTR